VHGGPVHSATLKFGFAMFRKRLNPAFSITPLTAGLFFAQHFGNNLHTTWDARYPKGYYWWPRNMRQHLFLSTCVAFHPGSELIEKIALYFEMNTNDLYLYSYIPNTRALQWHEIVFFGTGLKVFLH
jgi:hypothetical protein